MSVPCHASKRLGCPDCQTVLVCHQAYPHRGLNHYDAQEQVWWQNAGGAEPELYRAATPGEPAHPAGS